MFARRIHTNGNIEVPLVEPQADAVSPQPQPPAMLSMLSKTMFGISPEQLQEYMNQTGQLLAGYRDSLARIEARLDRIEALIGGRK